MATQFVISRVTELPTPLEADTLYIVKAANSDKADLVFTGNTSDVVGKTTTFAEVQAAATQAAAQAVSNGKSVFIYETYTVMQQSIPTIDIFAFVKDTTGDPLANTSTGAYVYSATDAVWYNLPTGSGGSGNDVLWTDVIGRPSSTPAQIDAAVAASTHTNRAVLNKLGETDGLLTYDGSAVSQVSVQSNW